MKRRVVDLYRGPTTLGVDVSRWQGEVAWGRVAQDPQRIRFAVVRTGDGKDADEHAVRNLVGAHEVGLRAGVYHYFRADRDGARQLALVREIVRVADVPILFAALDLEDGADDDLPGGIVPGSHREKLGATLVAASALGLLEKAERELHARVVVYAGQWFHWVFSQARPELAEAFGRWPLWVPSYKTPSPFMPVDAHGVGYPWTEWTIHQFTPRGTVQGIQGPVDLNRFRGDEALLQAWAATAEPRPHADRAIC